MKKFLIFLCAIALVIGFMGTGAASIIQNGTETEILPAYSPMPLDGTWIVIDEFVGADGFFTGDWDWDTTYSVLFSITDLYVVSDAFEVYDSGSLVLTTPLLPDYDVLGYTSHESPPWTDDPDVAWAEPLFSKGCIVFDPGYHDITIRAYHIPTGFSDATVAFKAEPVPEPATMLLLGSGLIGLALVGRKKFFRKGC